MEMRHKRPITVGELKSVLDSLPPETPVLVGVRDRHHFNTLLGDLPVVGATVLPTVGGNALFFSVETVS